MIVPPIGPRGAKIAIIGESPGQKELAQGVPFVGASGKDLDKYLRGAGLDRDEIYITNLIKDENPSRLEDKEKHEYFFEAGRPTAKMMQGILGLAEEFKEWKPNVFVPLGNYALWALTQKLNITKNRGSIIESTLFRGRKVIPTIHPAWYIHTFQNNKKLLANWDFQRIAFQSHFPEIRRKKRNFLLNPTAEEIEATIERFTDPSLDHLTADTEWYNPDTLAYIAFSDNDEEAVCIEPNSMLAFRAYKAILGSPIPKVWQNAMFDAVALHRLGIPVRNVAHDTMVAWHYCWGITIEEKSLAIQTSVLTEEPYYKDDGAFVGKDDRGKIYCCTDVVCTDECYTKMMKDEFEITGTRRGYEISMTIMNTFIKAAQVGIRADVQKLNELREKYLQRADETNARVAKAIGHPINTRSWQQVQRAVYDELGFGKRFTSRSTDQKVLMDIAATLYAEDPKDEAVGLFIDIIRERQDRNLVSRYINEGIVDTDGRIRCNWNLAGTKNGRLSSTKPWWNGVALQTMPEDAREVCVADPGHVFIGWDLAQAEARVVAIKARNWELLQMMENGDDIHLRMAAALPFGLTYEQHYAAMKAVVAEGKSKDQYAPRFLSKRTRHASNYIQSWMGLQQQINKDFLDTMIGCDAAMAKMLNSGFLEADPGLEVWWRLVQSAVNEDRYIENAFGRRRNWYQHVGWQDHEHKDAVAFYPQSTVGDLTTLSIAEVDKEEWVLPLTHMHDGGFIQVPESMKDDAIELVKRTMTKEIFVDRQPLTIPVDVKWGYNWLTMEGV